MPRGSSRLDTLDLTATLRSVATTFEFEGQGLSTRAGILEDRREDGTAAPRSGDRLHLAIGQTLALRAVLRRLPVLAARRTSGTTLSRRIRPKPKLYVVQTPTQGRCSAACSMTTDPGDLVLDPTCGSGTTAYVAEQWGRRWITIDTSRVPLALARQRLLTATFPYYELQDADARAGRRVRLQAQAEHEGRGGRRDRPARHAEVDRERRAAAEEVLVDRPEVDTKITRVTGPFVVEATIPTPVDFDGDGTEDSGVPEDASLRRPDARGAAAEPVAPARAATGRSRSRTSARRRSR